MTVKHLIFTTLLVFHLKANICLCFTSFVFGDSLVDAGNNDYLFTLSKANSPPYGVDFKPSGGRPTGRFTNGRTISDIIGQELGAKSFPPPYLAPNTEIEAIMEGINYASGASGILNETGNLFIGRVPLGQQVSYFEKSRNYMVNMIGENGTKEFLKKAIFSLTTGSNDILNYVQPSIPFLQSPKLSPSLFQDFLLSNLSMQLKRLHELGARKFVVVGIGPLGCIPFIRAINLLPRTTCSVHVNQLIYDYNKKLRLMLEEFNQELGSDSVFLFADAYDIVLNLIFNFRQYGFENGYEPCCGGSFPPFVCFKQSNESSEICNDRSKYVFWDAFHPTEAANIIIAKKLLDGDQTACFPINIRDLYNYNNP